LSNRPNQAKASAEPPDRPRRILHIGKYFPPHRGGMETVLRDQMNMQTRDEGLHVAAVVHSSERRLTDKVEVLPLGYRVRHAARWFTAIFAPIAPFFAWSVYREIRELDPDEIKIHMPNLSAFWLLFLPDARNRKWVVLWHSDVLPSKHSLGLRVFYRLYKPFETWLLKRADVVIATSPPYLDTSEPLEPFRDKCIVEPLEIDIERIPKEIREAPQPPKAPGEGVRVLCVGRLTYYKGFDTAIAAIAKISNAQLRIVGQGELKAVLEQYIDKQKVADRAHLLGDLSDAELYLQFIWCDVVCVPSIERTEAFGLVILEAEAMQRKVVVADIGGSGMPWIAASTSAGHQLFEARNVQSCSRAILT